MLRRFSAVAGVTALLLTGCLGSSPQGPSDEPTNQAAGGTEAARPSSGTASGLLGALDRVRKTAATAQFFAYGDVAAVRELSGGNPAGRFQSIQGVGYGDLRPYAKVIQGKAGFDPRDADTAIVAGKPPTQAGRLTGSFDANKINGRLAELGGKRRSADGGTLWVWHADGGVDLQNDPFPGLVGLLNVVFVTPETIAYGRSTDALAWVRDPGAQTLADSPRHVELARCLGDVTTATITSLGKGGAEARLYAVGVRAASGQGLTEVACVTTASKQAAGGLVQKIRKRWTTQPTTAGRPWSKLLADPKVEALGGSSHLVRLEAHPTSPEEPVGTFLQALSVGDLERLFQV